MSLGLMAVVLTLATGYGVGAQRQAQVDVYKTATCGCCANWVDHLRKHGFATTTTNVANMDGVHAKYNVPRQAQSCHTAVVEGYVIEGHVPAAEIERLLKERPDVVGLAVPGMPIGSPGMEGAGARPYNVLTFDKQGRAQVFSTQRP
jgi:hypothetical protein